MSFETLDVIIGLIGVYVFLSLICTTANELISQWLNTRAETLLAGLRKMLDGKQESTVDLDAVKAGDEKSFVADLYDHPFIQGMAEGSGKPSYISPKTFANALLDVLDPKDGKEPRGIEEVRDAIKEIPAETHPQLRTALLSMINDVGDDLDAFREEVKRWYNENMDRVASWYKKHVQRIIFLIALVVAAGANADTLRIVDELSSNEALRQSAVQQAQTLLDREAPPADTTSLKELARQTREYVEAYGGMGIPVGWESEPTPFFFSWSGFKFWISKAFGILLTTCAISLGAPFWFDVLRKVARLRSAGRSPREKKANGGG
jgi:hypothetical protein